MNYDQFLNAISIEDAWFFLAAVVIWFCFLAYLYSKKRLVLGINIFFIFLLYSLADILSYDGFNIHVLVAYTFLAISAGFFISVVCKTGVKFAALILKPVFIFSICFIPLFHILYYLIFDTHVTLAVFYAVFQSNTKEAQEYIFHYGLIKWLAALFFIIGILSYSLYRQSGIDKKWKRGGSFSNNAVIYFCDQPVPIR